jgi:hypothetical protein
MAAKPTQVCAKIPTASPMSSRALSKNSGVDAITATVITAARLP